MLLIIIKLLEFHGFIQDTILGFKSHDWVTVTTCDHMTGVQSHDYHWYNVEIMSEQNS